MHSLSEGLCVSDYNVKNTLFHIWNKYIIYNKLCKSATFNLQTGNDVNP